MLNALLSLTRPKTWPASFFKTPLKELSGSDARLQGIYMPKPEIGKEKVGLSEQFLSNAAEYVSRYADSHNATNNLRKALAEAKWQAKAGMEILDIGTGSGANSVVPCLQLFENCRIVATDLSPDLLAILRGYLVAEKQDHRVACVCTDSMKNHFKPERFDVVVGSAILHHLIDPETAIRTAFMTLKPGGTAFFMEPFEGFCVIGDAFSRILEDSNTTTHQLSEVAVKFCKAICTDLDARKGEDKTADRFKYMDDKWLFTRKYVDEAAKRAGFTSAVIVPYMTPNSLVHYRSSTEILIRCSGLDPAAIFPIWAWEKIDELDKLYDVKQKREMLLEGTIVLTK
jgi:2-polyprenyl-3-methyl-5-hydroxy-6-metoxy-1,4-benzoquinol methylase